MKQLLKTHHGEIYHGDCIQYLTRPPGKNEMIISDPPYGHRKKIIAQPGGKWKNLKNNYKPVDWNKLPAPEYFEQIMKRPYILSGANYYYRKLGIHPRLSSSVKKDAQSFSVPGDITDFLMKNPIGWLIWDKCRPPGLTFAGHEMLYTSLGIESETIPILWNGLCQPEPRRQYRVKRIHPAQKPADLWMAIIKNHVPPGTLVIDPYAGSCSLAIACEKMGYPYICIEKDEHHARQGAQWVKEHCQNQRLF